MKRKLFFNKAEINVGTTFINIERKCRERNVLKFFSYNYLIDVDMCVFFVYFARLNLDNVQSKSS